MREFARLLKDVIESNINERVDLKENIILWMVRWAATVASIYLVGKDGRTAYERKRGRRCRVPIAIFGEQVFYKPLDHSKDRSNIDAQWEWGLSRESNEALIGAERGVTRAYAVKRRPTDERWNRKASIALVGTPQKPNPERAGLHIPTRIAAKPGEPEGGVATGGAAQGGGGRIRRSSRST